MRKSDKKLENGIIRGQPVAQENLERSFERVFGLLGLALVHTCSGFQVMKGANFAARKGDFDRRHNVVVS